MIFKNLSVKNYFLLLFLIHTFFITSKSEHLLLYETLGHVLYIQHYFFASVVGLSLIDL